MNSMMFIPSTTRLEAVQPLPDAVGTALPCDIAGRSRVLRNSHALLSMALLFSGAIAAVQRGHRCCQRGVQVAGAGRSADPGRLLRTTLRRLQVQDVYETAEPVRLWQR